MIRSVTYNVRLSPAERDALERAAAADERPPSTLLRKLLLQWLREHGWMTTESKQ